MFRAAAAKLGSRCLSLCRTGDRVVAVRVAAARALDPLEAGFRRDRRGRRTDDRSQVARQTAAAERGGGGRVNSLLIAVRLPLPRRALFTFKNHLNSTGVFDHDGPTSTDAGFAHFQRASSDNALHRMRAGRRAADDLPPRLAEH